MPADRLLALAQRIRPRRYGRRELHGLQGRRDRRLAAPPRVEDRPRAQGVHGRRATRRCRSKRPRAGATSRSTRSRCDPLTGEILDPFNGRPDLEARRLRVVDPRTFGDDSLRVLRALQFAARFELELDRETRARSAARSRSTICRPSASGARVEKLLLQADAAVDRPRARARSRRRRPAVAGAESARRLPAGARVAPRRRRVGAHADGRRPGAQAHRRARTRSGGRDDARRDHARLRQARDDGRSSTAGSDRPVTRRRASSRRRDSSIG